MKVWAGILFCLMLFQVITLNALSLKWKARNAPGPWPPYTNPLNDHGVTFFITGGEDLLRAALGAGAVAEFLAAIILLTSALTKDEQAKGSLRASLPPSDRDSRESQ